MKTITQRTEELKVEEQAMLEHKGERYVGMIDERAGVLELLVFLFPNLENFGLSEIMNLGRVPPRPYGEKINPTYMKGELLVLPRSSKPVILRVTPEGEVKGVYFETAKHPYGWTSQVYELHKMDAQEAREIYEKHKSEIGELDCRQGELEGAVA